MEVDSGIERNSKGIERKSKASAPVKSAIQAPKSVKPPQGQQGAVKTAYKHVSKTSDRPSMESPKAENKTPTKSKMKSTPERSVKKTPKKSMIDKPKEAIDKKTPKVSSDPKGKSEKTF